MELNDRIQLVVPALLLVTGLGAGGLLFWTIQYGPGVSPDSTVYIETARSILAGNGFIAGGKPMTHYPPTYPLLLAIAALFHHGNVLEAGRWLCAILFGINLMLYGFAARISTGRSLTATICAILLFLSSAPILLVHSMSWSEAPFITFSLAALILLALYLDRPSGYLLMSAAFMVGLAMTTRYVGITLLPPMMIGILYLSNHAIKQRIKNLFLFTAAASIPLAAWLIRNFVVTQSVANRPFAIHPFKLHHLKSLITTMHDLALPIVSPLWVKALLCCCMLAVILMALAYWHRKSRLEQQTTVLRIAVPMLSILFVLTYLAFLILSISFLDALIPLNYRIMLPAYIFLTFGTLSLAWSLSQVLTGRIIWYGFLLLALLSITLNAQHTFPTITTIHQNGQGYTSRHLQSSKLLAYFKESSDNRVIYSNGPEIIRFLARKEARMIPARESAVSRLANPAYQDQLAQLTRKCSEGKALVVYFTWINWRWYLPSRNELEKRCQLPVLKRFSDGVIYGIQLESATGRPAGFPL